MPYNITDHILMKKWCIIKSCIFFNWFKKVYGNDWTQQKPWKLHSEFTIHAFLCMDSETHALQQQVAGNSWFLKYKLKGQMKLHQYSTEKNPYHCLRITEINPLKEITWHHITGCHCRGMLPPAQTRPGSGCFQKLLVKPLCNNFWSTISLISTPWQPDFFMCNDISSSLNVCHKLEEKIP